MAEQFSHRVSRRSLMKGAAGAALAASTPALPAMAAPALSAKPAPALHRLPSKQPSGEITLWYFAFAPHENGYKAVIEKYNQNVNANVTFNLESIPGADYDTKLRAALAAGQAPDVFNRHGPSIGEFASAGYLLPLSQNVATLDEVKTEFLLENYLQTASYGDVFAIGVPDPPGDAGLIINVDLAKEAGLDVPTAFESFDQLSEYAEKLTKRQGDTVVQAGLGFNEGNDPVYVNSYVVEQGKTFWDNATQKFTFSSPTAEATMQWFADIYLTKKWDSLDLPGDFDGVSQGVKAMSWLWPEYANFAKTVFPDLNLAFVGKPPFVAGNVPIFNHTDTWNAMAYSGTNNREAVEDFLRYLKSPEAQLTFAEQNPGLVILKKTLFEDPFYQTGPGAFLAPVIASIKAGQERYFGPWGNLDTLQTNIWWPKMTEILQGKTSVADGLAQMSAAADAELAKYLEKYPDAPKTTVYWTPAELPEGLSWS
jgi:ABC-type glycerol-3-phosphate transport system substrate-binding protein